MIDVKQLVKRYGPTLAVDDLSFHIPQGQIVGFLGPNGAGKSTTMRILTSFIPMSCGSAAVAGFDVLTQSKQSRANIGYFPENNPLYPEMRVEEFLHYRGKLHGLDRNLRNQRINEASDQCGLQQIRRRIIGQLSKGNRQRVGLAQTLLHQPKVIILDEPTSGLDPIQIVSIRNLFKQLSQKHTLLISSHVLDEVEKVADRILILRQGKLVADGSPQALCQQVSDGRVIHAQIKGDAKQVGDQLKALTSVKQVNSDQVDGWLNLTLMVKQGQSPQAVCQQVAALCAKQAWQLRQIAPGQAKLEDFYLQIFKQQDSQPKLSA